MEDSASSDAVPRPSLDNCTHSLKILYNIMYALLRQLLGHRQACLGIAQQQKKSNIFHPTLRLRSSQQQVQSAFAATITHFSALIGSIDVAAHLFIKI